eukprot:scaffold18138_cov128-Cylindrotheca_fusiformis.AAC.2
MDKFGRVEKDPKIYPSFPGSSSHHDVKIRLRFFIPSPCRGGRSSFCQCNYTVQHQFMMFYEANQILKRILHNGEFLPLILLVQDPVLLGNHKKDAILYICSCFAV